MSEIEKYTEYVLKKNNVDDLCDIDYSHGLGNQPIEVAKAGAINWGRYCLEYDEQVSRIG